ncbi:acyl-CoA dehydrogenase family protein [Cupriavidus nantongensis]|nr:acyl-CoA dehydrogenase family protein [Cupriavidus nantongensis]
MPIQAEAEDMLLASFDRLMREQHPVAYARSGPTLDEPGHYAKWALLDEGGWLELADCETEPQAYYPLALGEMMGRSLLNLPLAFSAYVLHPLCQQVPELLGAGTVLPWRQHPGVGRVDPAGQDGASGRFIDFHGRRACYYRLARADGRDDAWHIRRYDGAEVEVVTGLDVCGALASLPAGNPAAQAGFHLPLGSMQALLRRYLAVELAQTLGTAAAALDMAVAYATERRQFGKPIGQYQAIKHPLANAWVALDNGRYAIRALLDDGAAPGVAGIAARLVVAAATQATRLTIQVHGGIGFAWEHDAHLFLKRVYHKRTQVQRLASVL